MLELRLRNPALFSQFRKQREDHAKKKKKALVAVIYRVDLLKDTIAALQHVGGILQTASSLKLETSAEEPCGVLLCMTHRNTQLIQILQMFTLLTREHLRQDSVFMRTPVI